MSWQKYILAFVITAAIFGTAFYLASRINAERIADVREIQESISIDLLSSEMQFELLGNLGCSTLFENPILSEELNSLAARLSYTENTLGSENSEVIQLKKQYTLLEIKDYLLMQRVSEKCNTQPVSILYFYTNKEGCAECARMGEVLTYLRQTYPELRVYAFDYHLDLSALRTLTSILRVREDLPALVINDEKVVYGFKNLSEMEALVPELKTLATTSSSTPTR